MRNLHKLLIGLGLITVQVAFATPYSATDSVETKVYAEGVPLDSLALNTSAPAGIVAKHQAPDFDKEVLEPLKAAQAKAAAEAAARKRTVRRRTVRRVTAYKPATADAWYRLRLCESGNNYTRNSGNGYYGAYQFDVRTWGNWGGYARADLAPAAVQDAKAQETYARRGWSPWASCARKLGLM